jgi:hypothetical protein
VRFDTPSSLRTTGVLSVLRHGWRTFTRRPVSRPASAPRRTKDASDCAEGQRNSFGVPCVTSKGVASTDAPKPQAESSVSRGPLPSCRGAIWEHAFVTSQGSAHGRFRKALDNGNAVAALSAAAELPQLGLTDALELCPLRPRSRALQPRGRPPARSLLPRSERVPRGSPSGLGRARSISESPTQAGSERPRRSHLPPEAREGERVCASEQACLSLTRGGEEAVL